MKQTEWEFVIQWEKCTCRQDLIIPLREASSSLFLFHVSVLEHRPITGSVCLPPYRCFWISTFNSSTVDILDLSVLSWGWGGKAYLVHCRMCSCSPGLDPPDASSTPLPVVTTKHDYRNYQMFPEDQNCLLLRTTGVDPLHISFTRCATDADQALVQILKDKSKLCSQGYWLFPQSPSSCRGVDFCLGENIHLILKVSQQDDNFASLTSGFRVHGSHSNQ